MNKLRADKFDIIADKKSLMKIQEQAQKYKDDFGDISTIEGGNRLIHLYSQIAFDEGYRRCYQDTMETLKSYHPSGVKKPKRRRKGWFEYIEEGDIESIVPLIKRRIASKRQRKEQKKLDEENGRKFCEEHFILSMAIHTSFEAGYLKADSIEEQAKIVCRDQDQANIVLQLLGEVFKEYEKVQNEAS
jgi:hypothetical protein